MRMAKLFLFPMLGACASAGAQHPDRTGAQIELQRQLGRRRAHEHGIVAGTLPAGPLDAITDVAGVRVGHCTRIEGDAIRTGVTVVAPHGGDPFQHKVPAAIVVFNGFGKLAGSTQVDELGELETPIALTNTLSVGVALTALVRDALARPGNEQVRSVNAVVGETNDGLLNDIRGMHVTEADVLAALRGANGGACAGGAVGAGTGTVAFGRKGGIGTASRVVARDGGSSHVVGVLVQANFGRDLRVLGRRVDAAGGGAAADGDGSCVIILATDAPLDALGLRRLAQRCFAGMARTCGTMTHGSGDYAIAFSTAYRIPARPAGPTVALPPLLHGGALTPLFQAAEEATEQAIYDALCLATPMRGRDGREVPAFAPELSRRP
jgi:D-aminopeptidase